MGIARIEDEAELGQRLRALAIGRERFQEADLVRAHAVADDGRHLVHLDGDLERLHVA